MPPIPKPSPLSALLLPGRTVRYERWSRQLLLEPASPRILNWRIHGALPARAMRLQRDFSSSTAFAKAKVNAALKPTTEKSAISKSPSHKPASPRSHPPPAQAFRPIASTNSKSSPPSQASPTPSPSPAKAPPLAFQPTPDANPKLNPPEATYPAPISIPSRGAEQGRLSYYYNAGKAYIAFYKEGIRRVRGSIKLAKGYRARARNAISANKQSGESNTKTLAMSDVLTRAEYQVVRRTRVDLYRLPVFGFLVLIMGEYLPLFALWLTPLVPEACRIPAQINKLKRTKEERRREREKRLGMDAPRIVGEDRRLGCPPIWSVTEDGVSWAEKLRLSEERLGDLGMFDLLSVGARLDAYGGVWDRLFLYPPKWWLRRDVRRRLRDVRLDDELIRRDGGWKGLGPMELERFCLDRGISTVGKGVKDLKSGAGEWFGE